MEGRGWRNGTCRCRGDENHAVEVIGSYKIRAFGAGGGNLNGCKVCIPQGPGPPVRNFD